VGWRPRQEYGAELPSLRLRPLLDRPSAPVEAAAGHGGDPRRPCCREGAPRSGLFPWGRRWLGATLTHAGLYQIREHRLPRTWNATAIGFAEGRHRPFLDEPATIAIRHCMLGHSGGVDRDRRLDCVRGSGYDGITAEPWWTWSRFAVLSRKRRRFDLPMVGLRGISDGRAAAQAGLHGLMRYLHDIDHKLARRDQAFADQAVRGWNFRSIDRHGPDHRFRQPGDAADRQGACAKPASIPNRAVRLGGRGRPRLKTQGDHPVGRGPASVLDKDSPPARRLRSIPRGVPVLGICYGEAGDGPPASAARVEGRAQVASSARAFLQVTKASALNPMACGGPANGQPGVDEPRRPVTALAQRLFTTIRLCRTARRSQ